MVGNFPELAPKSVSSPQMAMITAPGTPNCCSIRLKIEPYCCSSRAARAKPRRHHAAGELLEALPENALRVVARDDAGVVGDAGQTGRDRALRNALRCRFLLDAFEPGAEIAAARRRGQRWADRQHHHDNDRGREPKCDMVCS